MRDFMLDLETLGSKHDSVILSIGLVAFDLEHVGVPGQRDFYAVVNTASCLDHGRRIDSDTEIWWQSQSADARRVLDDAAHSTITLPQALHSVNEYIESLCSNRKRVRVWGFGSTFDNIVIRDSYRACGIEPFWTYRGDMCFRTLRALRPGVVVERVGTHHNALDDARYQATLAQAVLRSLSIGIDDIG